ncbi:MAG: DUF4214 domain-containing protein [Pseudomonadota bacterium]
MAITLTQVQALYIGYFNRAGDPEGVQFWLEQDMSPDEVAQSFSVQPEATNLYPYLENPAVASPTAFLQAVYLNLFNRALDEAGRIYWEGQLANGTTGEVIQDIISGAQGDDAVIVQNKVTAASDWTSSVANVSGFTFAQDNLPLPEPLAAAQDVIADVDETDASVDDAAAKTDAFVEAISGPGTGLEFDLVVEDVAGANSARITGDQDMEVDVTSLTDQVVGLDLNGNGVVDNDGIENNDPTALDDGIDFAVFDLYRRDLLNDFNTNLNYLGDVAFDGTGFEGDGVSTDGNIYLGGLGSDTALGGIGNDFMTGGGIAQNRPGFDQLFGGRNADFFYAEINSLDATADGALLAIDGGSTSDDAAVGNNTPQDSDWLLLEVSDDEDGTVVVLDDFSTAAIEDGSVTSPIFEAFSLTNVEHVDASGNLYGFLDDVDVALGDGGSVTDDGENVGVGSTAQLAIFGSDANNILIGGFDNDRIEGDSGSDLLFGGRTDYINNPNITQIINDGRDELFGDSGDDNLVWEADGGVYEGATEIDINAGENDSLWLTELSFGTQTADDLLADGIVRIDLGANLQGGNDNFTGYNPVMPDGYTPENGVGSYTADQTNYADGVVRTTVQDMNNVIATGLGGIDYSAAGTNDPELLFNNQQNILGIDVDLDLRGNSGDNVLYGNTGDDVIEGRTGDDSLSGGLGNDDFIFDLGDQGSGSFGGDDLNIIHRQADFDGDNLWDTDEDGAGIFTQDFGVGGESQFGPSVLTVDFTLANIDDANVFVDSFSVVIGGETFAVTDMAALEAASTIAELVVLANTEFNAQDENVSVTTDGANIIITDATPAGGRVISSTPEEGYAVSTSVTAPGTSTLGLPNFTPAGETVFEDRIIFQAYEDRADNERIDDDAIFGAGDSLGIDNYAEDLVVGFLADDDGVVSTVLAEDQSFRIDLENLAVEDEVTVSVNGVQFTLTVGKDLDDTLIAGETTEEFAERMSDFINDFLDDDTAAGEVQSAYLADPDGDSNTGAFVVSQVAYDGEETVFMVVDVDVDENSSLGEPATAAVTNQTQTEVDLFEYDGRNGNLDEDNVLFWGDQAIQRSHLLTAEDAGDTLLGTDAIVINVEQADEILSARAGEGVADGTLIFGAENPTTVAASAELNYSVHGDDQFFTGLGSDIVDAGTGDDRVYGSNGLDVLDGGKDIYLVDGELRVLNLAEAADVDGDPEVESIQLLPQNEAGGPTSGLFRDTLIYQQSTFGAVGAAGSVFEITLDLSEDQDFGGAGKVIVDGDAVNNTTLFTNFENIRTVSGDGTLAGQGRDTLDLANTVNPITGVEGPNGVDTYYALTTADTDPTSGQVRLDFNDDDSFFGTGELIAEVDGVENVDFGSGDDVMVIDETEAGKDNVLRGGLGDDTVNYSFEPPASVMTPENLIPMVSLFVNGGGTDTDLIEMTGGILGTDVPVDTLVSFENVNFSEGSGDNPLANPMMRDLLDVSAVNAAVVDFTGQEVRAGGDLIDDETPEDSVINIGGMDNFEDVVANGAADTVIVSDDMDNSNLSDEDFDLQFDTFLNYDIVDAAFERQTIGDLRAAPNTAQGPDEDDIPEAENIGLYSFALGEGADTVDYSDEVGAVVAVVEFDDTTTDIIVDSVFVSEDDDLDFTDDGNRVDVLDSVENLAASQGLSVIDLTSSETDLEIRYNFDDGPFANEPGLDRDVFRIQLSELSSAQPVTGVNFLEYRDAGDSATTQEEATWSTIEGSDNDERVELTDNESIPDNFFNLRGGDNEVNYNELTRSIELLLGFTDLIGDDDVTDDAVLGSVTFTDGAGAALPDGGTDTITSYSSANVVSAGTLRIEASQDDEDSVSFDSGAITDKVFLLGEVVDGSDQITVSLGTAEGGTESIVLTGFELITDDDLTDDVYEFLDLERALNQYTLVDGPIDDRDTIKVGNDAVQFTEDNGGNPDEVSLEVLNDAFMFDFDILDVTNITEDGLTIVADLDTMAAGRDIGNDEIVVGAVDGIDTVTDFAVHSITDATIDDAGNAFIVNAAALEIQDGSGDALYDIGIPNFLPTTFDASRTTEAVDLSIFGTLGLTLVGGSAGDTLTGAGGDDVLEGGLGNDTMDGGIAGEVRQIQLDGILAAGASFTLGGVTVSDGNGDFGAAAGSDEVGQALADVWGTSANLTAINAALTPEADLIDVSFDAFTDQLTFTFDEGADVLDATLDLDTDIASATSGTFALSGQNVVVEGSDGGADTFVLTTAGGVDEVVFFSADPTDTTDDLLAFTDFAQDAVTVTAGTFGVDGAAADLTLAANQFGTIVTASGTISDGNVVEVGTAAFGEIIVGDNGFAFVGVADDLTAETMNIYAVFDDDEEVGVFDGEAQLIATVGFNDTTFGDVDATNVA